MFRLVPPTLLARLVFVEGPAAAEHGERHCSPLA